ncbi:unnamed protein product [Rotaria sp. Silwood1]|nr:unnamed protein product [Rotaria sp. Silwood1]
MDDVDFRCAFLDGSKVKLTFANSLLVRAKFRKTCARDVFFGSANFESVQMDGMICANCVYRDATMSHAHLNNIHFYREHSNEDIVYDAYENINFTETSLVDATFERLSLHGTLFIGANMSRIRIIKCRFHRDLHKFASASFQNSTLVNATIQNSSFDEVHFAETNLSGASISVSNFTYLFMINVDLMGATLEMCNFTGANLAGCKMTDANIYLSYFVKTNLTGCHGITDAQLAQATSIAGAILPNGTQVP